MANTITRRPRGESEVVKVEGISIPDLWHVAMLFNDANELYLKQQNVKAQLPYPDDNPELDNVTITIKGSKALMIKDAILETWNLCHDLLENLQNPEYQNATLRDNEVYHSNGLPL